MNMVNVQEYLKVLTVGGVGKAKAKELTESDNDDDDFVHPKLSTFDEEERHKEKLDEEEDGSDQRTPTPSHFESTNDEAYDEVTQKDNVEEEKLDEEKTYEEEEVNEMYNDIKINLKGRETIVTDALLANVQATQVIEDTHVIMTVVTLEVQQQSSSVSLGFISKMLNPNPDTCIDSILNLNIELTSLVDVPITTNDEIPPSSVTTLLPPPIPLIQHVQQTFVTTPTIAPILLIPSIVDKYLANQMNESIKAVVQLQSDRLKDEAKAKNEDFINKIDDNIKKIIKEKVKVQVKEQVSKNLEVRIKKMKARKEPESSSAPKDKTSKSIGLSKGGSKSKTRSTDKSAQAEEQVHLIKDLEEPAPQEFETGFTKDHPIDETTQLPD
uniref:Uncharacterized protein n=1 Tax=Tanacetum cinerariifolium TaxID=118510 RepID=A0A6L2N7G5_TANCI|nr:hypothetical protein [Tanacetum cinerariifolium]